MAWNKQGGPWGGGGGGQGPWGGGGSGGGGGGRGPGGPGGGMQPPDVEEALRRAQDKLKILCPARVAAVRASSLSVLLSLRFGWPAVSTGFQPDEQRALRRNCCLVNSSSGI